MQTLGKYEIIERLGHGGMAEVYRGYHKGLDRYVAIKVLHTFIAEDADFKARFQREAQNVARLNHPNIMQAYDYEYDEKTGSYFMVTELIEGQTLEQHLKKLAKNDQYMPLAEALQIIRQLGVALAYAHSHYMIHRDVKPANIMLGRDGRIILTDFGIARIVRGEQTTAGGMVGSPAYMSPEQCRGEAEDERTDLYALGVIFYKLLTGEVPYDADSPMEIILNHLDAPIPSVRKLRPDLPIKVDQLITRLLAKRPEDRYQSADALLSVLDSVSVSRIFISYRRADWEHFVEPLITRLKAEGLSWWVDQHLIEGGADWMDEINRALKECDSMILCISPEALESRHVKMEYRYFFNNHKPIYPLICRQPDELPAELQIIQHYPYAELEKLLQQIKSH